jgi:hypothetical protein
MFARLKLLGAAVLAPCLIGAIAPQLAAASPLTIDPPTPPQVYVTDLPTVKTVFTTPSGSVECTTASFSGNGTPSGGAVNEVTLAPTFSGCTAFGFATAHVKANGCTYTFTTPHSIGSGSVTWTGSQVHLLCPAGKSLETTPTAFGVSVCTQSIAPQTPTSGHAVGTNVSGSSPMHAKVQVALSGFHYTGTGSSCGNSETHSDGKVTVTLTRKCYADPEHSVQVGCTFS